MSNEEVVNTVKRTRGPNKKSPGRPRKLKSELEMPVIVEDEREAYPAALGLPQRKGGIPIFERRVTDADRARVLETLRPYVETGRIAMLMDDDSVTIWAKDAPAHRLHRESFNFTTSDTYIIYIANRVLRAPNMVSGDKIVTDSDNPNHRWG